MYVKAWMKVSNLCTNLYRQCEEPGRRLFSVWTGLRLHLDGLDGGHLRQVGIHTRQGSLTAWDIVVVSWACPPFLSCSGRRRMQNKAQFLGREWAKAERLGRARRKVVGISAREKPMRHMGLGRIGMEPAPWVFMGSAELYTAAA